MAITVLLTAHGRPAEALVVLVCFCALLRVGEAINLCREDFVFGDAQLVILLRTTKTGSHQRVVIDNVEGILYLHGLLKRVEDPIRAAPTTYSTFRRYFTRAGCPWPFQPRLPLALASPWRCDNPLHAQHAVVEHDDRGPLGI